MRIARWTRAVLDRRDNAALLDELDDVDAVVLEEVSDADDVDLGWCRRAPCVVVGITSPGATATSAVDVVLGSDEHDELDAVLGGITTSPRASGLLVDVLRVVDSMPVERGLVVESLAYSTLLGSSGFRTWLDRQPERRSRRFDGPAVRVARIGNELSVTLSRPENRNAFSAALRDELTEALLAAELDRSVDRVQISADGPVFSSGGDLTEFGTGIDLDRAHQIRMLRSPGASIARLGDRVSVQVQGACVGAGVEVPAFAHCVSAATGTTFRLPEIGMGLIPGAGGTVSISHRIGRQRTAEFALSGRTMEVDEALAIGLVDGVRD